MRGRSLVRGVAAHIRANVVGYVALFVALSGAAYAGVKPLLDKRGSVTSANIKDGTVSKKDLGPGSVGESELSSKLKRQLRLGAFVPVPDGTYAGTTTDTRSGSSVTITATIQNYTPTSVSFTSNNPNCTTPPSTSWPWVQDTYWGAPPDSDYFGRLYPSPSASLWTYHLSTLSCVPPVSVQLTLQQSK